jgi:REP element-mobilizing transposase RayT
MSENKYQNKYRIPSNRLQGYNYGSSGCYYVTICTQNREHYFGRIVDGAMQLSKIGNIAKSEWLKTPELRPDMNLILDEFVIMPNHFHCIVCIGDNQYNIHNTEYRNKFGVQSKNLASIIRGFKIAVTTYAKKHNIDFSWQTRFYDRIIHNNNGLEYVRAYIFNNPKKWDNDAFYTVGM